MRTLRWLVSLVALALVVGCGSGDDDSDAATDATPAATGQAAAVAPTPALERTLVVYSGRAEPLLEPVVAEFRKATGVDVKVKYGSTTELGNALIEEKSNPQADVFVGTDAATAEALREKGVFAPFTSAVLQQVPAEFRAEDGTWVGVTGRARVIMYNKTLLSDAELPKSVFELTDPKWRGKVAIPATSNSSFTAWVSALRLARGDDATKKYLSDLKKNDVSVLKDHTAVRQAVGKGEFPLGLVNHYYYQLQKAEGSPVGVIYPDQGRNDIGVLVNVAAASLVKDAERPNAAKAFMEFLFTPEAQRIFAEKNFEYPLIPGVPTIADVPMDKVKRQNVSLVRLGKENAATLDMLDSVGLK